MTTFDPGDNDVLIYGLILIPFSTAFFANKPAPTMTSGFEVLVHEVMAANTTEPCLKVCYYPLNLNLCYIFALSAGTPNPLNPTLFGTHEVKSLLTSDNGTLSCGLFGPEMHGSTVLRSNSRISVNWTLSWAL